VLALMKALIRDHYQTPSEHDRPERAILNDFLPKGRRFANEKTSGRREAGGGDRPGVRGVSARLVIQPGA
jgi:hypothetical protein